MRNAYREFMDLMPPRPLQVGQVTAVVAGVATVAMPGGRVLQARGEVQAGQRVFVRDGVIEGPAPNLTYVEGEA
ncbi:hypothetical protein [Paracidovorax valerianellae]|uniref:Uncharacterized protein n=1 Tax=Paracidovorax valerianellae TaxID=187868 RepID=A0A1G7ELI1_9BURK|nr:hypothetical protein [Paracidovorax valerianellae]MDA8446391.1 hypothetical protein [Paracidovorax valerianellae]SDE64265.1 hypothetical protein SAMN05192589_12358 [Paracidovorax valerianellae]